MLYCDLDYFKHVNDRYGHTAGDQLLVDVADVLRANTRDVDLVARVGGDEFVLVCPDLDVTRDVVEHHGDGCAMPSARWRPTACRSRSASARRWPPRTRAATS